MSVRSVADVLNEIQCTKGVDEGVFLRRKPGNEEYARGD